jgi:hypothetical protein
MHRTAALLLALLAATSLLAQTGSKAKVPADKAPADASEERLVPVGVLSGVVQDAGGKAGTLALRVTWRWLEPNAPAQEKYARRYQELLQRQAAVLRNPNAAQRQQQMTQLQKDAGQLMAQQKDLFRVREKQEDLTLILADEVKVRSADVPEPFDSKGNIRKYTPEELKDLKGPENLPGYRAELTDLRPGQRVLVQLAVRRKAAPPPQPTKSGPAPSQKDSPSPPAAPADKDAKPVVALIVVADLMK